MPSEPKPYWGDEYRPFVKIGTDEKELRALADAIVRGASIAHAEITDLRALIEAVQSHPNVSLRPPKNVDAIGDPSEVTPTALVIHGGRVDTCDCAKLDIRVTLTAATFFGDEAHFDGATFGDNADFERATFGERARFYGATFGEQASFDDATFGEQAHFGDASFGEQAHFDDASFGEQARFYSANFGEQASFDRATFGEQAHFGNAKFGEEARFCDATFGEKADFQRATFGKQASFYGATFGEQARFDRATFGKQVNFHGATFGEQASFHRANFAEQAFFDIATFGERADFDGATFGDEARFYHVTFAGQASFHGATFGDEADFVGATFGDEAHFGGAIFGAQSNFAVAVFGEQASFYAAIFGDEAHYANATFGKRASFGGATFGEQARFDKATFGEKASFADATFGERANFADATLGERALITDAVFDRADLRGTRGLLFDETRIAQVQMEGNAPDPWSKLRRQYTGPWFFVHLILLVIFFAPYVANIVALTAASKLQENMLEYAEVAEQRLRTYQQEHPSAGRVAVDWTDAHNRLSDMQDAYLKDRKKLPAVWILIGGNKGWWVVAMAIVLMFYNAMRALLTLRVSALRDAEERSNVTPRLDEYYGICHPLNDEDGNTFVAGVRTWLKGMWSKRLFAVPNWLRRRLPDNLQRRFLREQPPSLIASLGLYRIHQLARLIMWIAILATAWNSLVWARETWLWV